MVVWIDKLIFVGLKLVTLCGILGIWLKNNLADENLAKMDNGVKAMQHRGPDYQAVDLYKKYAIGHARLSIIDVEAHANQPFHSKDKRYTLVFNGEIYNYKALKKELIENGKSFTTDSDTEVLLELLIVEGKEAIHKLNGFFAFAFIDHQKEEILLVRDRLGIKPLVYYEDKDYFLFGSDLSSFFEFNIDKTIDTTALNYYFGLTYVPAPKSILENVSKLLPGELLIINHSGLKKEKYYSIDTTKEIVVEYEDAQLKVKELLEASVRLRLIADVPLGCFLSGGVDSSIIAAISAKYKKNIKTYAIGFDHPYFNESGYSETVAKHIGSDHQTYMLTKADFKANFSAFLDAIDEPFADSSAFAVYMLSKKVKQHVTVALSGDGADELFGGYRKHYAEFRLRKMNKTKKRSIKGIALIMRPLKSNRSDRLGELNRKLQKLAIGLKSAEHQRYWGWCQFINLKSRKKLLKYNVTENISTLNGLDWKNLNSILYADQTLVLPNDMLKKVDLMSMASSLEVRTPFLDHHLVEYVNSLPVDFKINQKGGKQILKDAFSDHLPAEIFSRSKKGFEIPIYDWLSEEIGEIMNGPLFTAEFVKNQGLFNYEEILKLKNDWGKTNFGDKIYIIWALIVFQHWWNRFIK